MNENEVFVGGVRYVAHEISQQEVNRACVQCAFGGAGRQCHRPTDVACVDVLRKDGREVYFTAEPPRVDAIAHLKKWLEEPE